MAKKLRLLLCLLCAVTLLIGLTYRNNRNRNFDYVSPELVVDKDEIKVGIDASDEQLLKGISAYDKVDGDVSDRIIIERLDKDPEGKYNEFIATYVCFDKSGNTARTTRKVEYTDYVRPHFHLDSDMRFSVNTTVSLFDYITAEDSLDGNISSFITIDGSKDLGQVSSPGSFLFELSVTNSVGDTATLPIQVELYEDTYEEQVFKPTINLTDYLVYIAKDSDFNPGDYVDYINDEGRCVIERGEPSDVGEDDEEDSQQQDTEEGIKKLRRINIKDIKIDSGVNTKKEGVYNVGFSYTSENGYTGNTKMIVVVE